jgi:hypothetical protein
MITLTHLKEGIRIYLTSLKTKRRGFRQYQGSAEEICKQIVHNCWTGRFFQTSTTNFAQFWTRDFNWCCKSLVQLGHQEKVKQTLDYALTIFQKHNQITTTITPSGTPYNVYHYAVDSLPSLINALKTLNDQELINQYKPFLESEITKFFNLVIEKETGLVKRKNFSSMKDYSKRKSSCYDNCMVAFLANNLKKLNLINPFEKYNYPQLIKQQFWNGQYFYDDLNKQNYVAGDANLFPFALGIFNDQEMLKSCLNHIQKEKLDQPFPLKYTNHRPEHFIWLEFLVRGYEKDTLWQHMAPLYIKLTQITDQEKFDHYHQQMTQLIEKHKNFLEVFHPNGQPFKSPFYHCDQGMLWAANYLTLK